MRVVLVSRLVLPLDGSPQANAVLPLAVGLAPLLHCPVLLLRCVSDAGDEPEASRHLAGVAHEITRNDVEVESRVVVGSAPVEIVAAVQSADLVAVGLRARSETGPVLRALLDAPAPLLLRMAGGRRVMRPKIVGFPRAGAAGEWGATLADLIGARAVTVKPSWREGEMRDDSIDLLVVPRDAAVGLVLQRRCDIPVLAICT
jgi:hypothetical protein